MRTTERMLFFLQELADKVTAEAALRGKFKFNGCFVGTAMNHRAARYTEIAEQPITAAAAATALRAALSQFRGQRGELYERMMADSKPGSTYPLARITAMHTYRLATVLEGIFDPKAQLFFARNGVDSAGNDIDCEWTVGAFASDVERQLSGINLAHSNAKCTPPCMYGYRWSYTVCLSMPFTQRWKKLTRLSVSAADNRS